MSEYRKKTITVAVLCGGRGERMGELTETTPKSLLKVAGKTVIERILDELASSHITQNVLLCIGYKGDQIRNKIGNSYRNLEIEYLHYPKLIETKRRIQLARVVIDGDFLVTCADVLLSANSLEKFVSSYYEFEPSKKSAGAVLASTIHGPAEGHSLIGIENGFVTSYEHHPPSKWTGTRYRDVHTYIFNDNFFDIFSKMPNSIEWIERAIMFAMEKGVTFRGIETDDIWYHFAEQSDLSKIEGWSG